MNAKNRTILQPQVNASQVAQLLTARHVVQVTLHGVVDALMALNWIWATVNLSVDCLTVYHVAVQTHLSAVSARRTTKVKTGFALRVAIYQGA